MGNDLKEIIEAFESGASAYFEEDTYIDIVLHYKKQKNFDKATLANQTAIQQYPFSYDFQLLKVLLLMHKDELELALKEAKQVLQLYPNDINLLKSVCDIYYQQGDTPSAIACLYDILDIVVEEKDFIRTRIAFLYQDINEYEKAIRIYKNIVKRKPQKIHVVYELNYCLEHLGKLEEHLAFYEKFTDEDPYNHFAWHNLGITYAMLDDFEKALWALDLATVANEEADLSYLEMGHIYMNLKNYKDAQEKYTLALEYGEEDPDLLCCLGATYEYLGDYKAGIINYKAALKVDKDWADAWFGVGSCLIEQEKHYEALHFLKKAIKLKPQQERYWFFLAKAEHFIGNLLASEEAYQEAIAIYAYNAEVWLGWSKLYYEQGRENEAIRIIKEGIEECPNEAKLYYQVAAYFLATGDYKKAFEYLENALLLNFDEHTMLFEFFDDLKIQKTIHKIIKQIIKEDIE